MAIEWALAAAILLASLALLPRLLGRAKAAPPHKSGGGSGVMIAIGIAFSMIFDAKASQAIELIQRKKDIGDSEAGENGDKPD